MALRKTYKNPNKKKKVIKKREEGRASGRVIHAVKAPFLPGNQLWMLRAKDGRDKLFADAASLWSAALEYFNYIDANPIIKIDFRGPYNDQVNIPLQRPYTIQGLCLYLDCNVSYFNQFEHALANKKKENWSESDKDFSFIIARIRQTIYNQKLEGAASGIFVPNIIARDLGLVDKSQADINGEVTVKQITGMLIMQGGEMPKIEDAEVIQEQITEGLPLLIPGIDQTKEMDPNILSSKSLNDTEEGARIDPRQGGG